ncbi:MAG TPA: segregation/condensation protein A [Nitrospirae bacterium]|nr:segregation/condensation protein A [Nitrospirota bacterium]
MFVFSEKKYSVKLPVFEGPLDLLLHLIRENKIDIYDIPITLITKQYLEYIELMKELNLEIASEFIVMAATLIYIKSRMLLPIEEGSEEALEDPRANLINRLLEYQAFKEASQVMREREAYWSNVFFRNFTTSEQSIQRELTLFDLNIFDLLNALKRIIKKVPSDEMIINRETLTVKDRITIILEVINEKKTVSFEALFSSDCTKKEILVTFLALLEIMRLGLSRVYQETFGGTIWISGQEEMCLDTEEKSYS